MTGQSDHLIVVAGGIIAHLIYFNKGEHHRNGTKYLKAALSSFCLLAGSLRIVFSRPLTSSLKSSAAILGYFLLGLYSSVLFYRLLLHPLNRFPGPIAARVGNLWLTTQLANYDMHKKSLDLYKTYGPFVRIGSSELMIAHPLAVPAIHGSRSACRKADMYDFEQPNRGISTRDREVHHGRRKLWTRGFSDKALRGYESRIAVYTKLLLDRLDGSAGRPVDAGKLMGYFAFDIMGDLGFGKDFGMLKNDRQHWAIALLEKSVEIHGRRLPMWLIRLLVESPLVPTGSKGFPEFCHEQLEAMMINEKRFDRPSIMAPILAHYEELDPSERDISALMIDCGFLIVAGSDTVAATLAFIFYYLAKYPEHISRLRKELLPLESANGTYEHHKIQYAEHLNAIINETLRLHPPASTISRLTPPEGIMVDGTFIPGNMTVFTSQYVIGRSEAVYEKADEFVPDRWYSRPEMIKERAGYAPFSIGSYSCLGRPLALMELRLVVAKCVSRFNVEFAPGFDSNGFLYGVKDCLSWHVGDLKLCFTPFSSE